MEIYVEHGYVGCRSIQLLKHGNFDSSFLRGGGLDSNLKSDFRSVG